MPTGAAPGGDDVAGGREMEDSDRTVPAPLPVGAAGDLVDEAAPTPTPIVD